MKNMVCVLTVLLAVASSNAQDLRVVDSLQKELSTAKHDTTRANILFYISKAYWGSDPTMAMGFAEQCLAFSERNGYKKGIGMAYQSMSSISYDRGDYFQAVELNRKSIKIRTEIADKKGIASCYNLFGMIYQKQGNTPESMKNYLASVSIAEQIGDKNGIANSTIGMGLIYLNQQNYSAALKSFSTALKLKTELGEKVGIFTSYNNIASVYQSQGNYEEALKNHFASFTVAEEIGNKSGIASSFNNIGVAYLAMGNYTEALKHILRAKKLREELGDKSAIINSYINLGYLYLLQKKYKEADEHNNMALSLAKEIGKLGALMNGYENLSLSDSAQGNFRKALEHYKQFIAFRDSLRNSDNIKKVVAMQMNYEFGKKEDSSKAVQEKKDALAKAEIEMQRLTNELLAKQYDDSLAKKEHEKKLTALNMQYDFDRTQDSSKAYQAKRDAVADKELQQQKLVRNGFIGGFGVMLLFSGLFLYQRNRIKNSKKQSDSLLLNILPAEVAEELKSKGTASAKHFDNVTVLFTDFKSFTTVSEQLSPQELVDELHTCFKAFDEICGKYSIEKIKTIGDAYLAVCGLPLADEKHAENVVNAALEIREFMDKRRANIAEKTFEVRIGINSGSVVAGIVGVKKFAYDIWGDTVNTAARMEQNSEAGKINISETTYELVKEKFTCEYRGEIDAKNKGKLKMYFIMEKL